LLADRTYMIEVGVPVRRAFDQWNVAGTHRRVGAFAVDSVIVLTIVAFLILASKTLAHWPGYFCFWVVGMWVWEAFWVSWKTQTPGRMVFKIFVHSPRHDGAPQSLQVTLRILNFWFGLFFLGIGITPILYRRDRRGWHDLLSETVTLGATRDEPSAIEQRVGRALSLLQALVGFSSVGALFMAMGLRPERIRLVHFEEAVKEDSCRDPKVLLSNPPEALLALSLSPAWAQCWSSKKFGLNALKDAEFFRMAEMAYRYNQTWVLQEDAQAAFYNSRLDKDWGDSLCAAGPMDLASCRYLDSGRGVASFLTKPLSELTADEIRQRWMKENLDFYLEFSQADSASRRIQVLEARLSKSPSQLVKQAIEDRLWVERLALGERPLDRQPSSISNEWNQEQVCWLQALGIEDSPECSDHPIVNYASKITDLFESDLSLEEADFYLADLDDQSLPSDFTKAVAIWKSVKTENSAQTKALMGTFPTTSPLYSRVIKLTGMDSTSP
jgi:uncharacterized RDD family membrane protein YckC